MTFSDERQRARDRAADAIATRFDVVAQGDGHGNIAWNSLPAHGTDARYKSRSAPCKCRRCTEAHNEAGKRYAKLRTDRKRLTQPPELPWPFDDDQRIKPHVCASDGCGCLRTGVATENVA